MKYSANVSAPLVLILFTLLLDSLLVSGKNKQIQLRSRSSSEHINEKEDEPYHDFGYSSVTL